MGAVQIVATSVAAAITIVAVVLVTRTVRRVLAVGRPGQPARPRTPPRRSRFTGSTMWQAYYVEYTILAVLLCGFFIRGFKAANDALEWPVWAAPVSHALGSVLPASPAAVSLIAMAKIIVSMAWVIVIASNITMGVAWHRFLAFFNIYFKREPGRKGSGLGALRPMMSDGKPLDFEEADPEKDQFGVAQVEQFTWKGLLDFSTRRSRTRADSMMPGSAQRLRIVLGEVMPLVPFSAGMAWSWMQWAASACRDVVA